MHTHAKKAKSITAMHSMTKSYNLSARGRRINTNNMLQNKSKTTQLGDHGAKRDQKKVQEQEKQELRPTKRFLKKRNL